MSAIIITSATPPPDGLPLGGDVYEVHETRVAVVDEAGKAVLDAKGQPATETGYLLPEGAVKLDKAGDRAAAIKPRFDLPASHPLFGLPARAAGLSGQGDELMGSDGAWHPVRDAKDVDELIAAGLVRREEPVKPGEVKPAEEAIRG